MNPSDLERILHRLERDGERAGKDFDRLQNQVADLRARAEGTEKRVPALVEETIASYRTKIRYFLLGLSLLLGAALVFDKSVRYPLLELIYPPARTLEQVRLIVIEDKDARARLRQALFSESEYPEVTLRKFPGIDQELPTRVWKSLQEGDKSNFAKLVNKPEFFDTLRDAYEKDLSKLFESINSGKQTREILERVKRAGGIPLAARIKVVGKEYDKNGTACGLQFDHAKVQAIIAIPKTSRPNDYWWYDCGPRSPRVLISVTANDGALELKNVSLIGVERHLEEHIEVRLSQHAAQRLGAPGAESYSVRLNGAVSVSEASW